MNEPTLASKSSLSQLLPWPQLQRQRHQRLGSHTGYFKNVNGRVRSEATPAQSLAQDPWHSFKFANSQNPTTNFLLLKLSTNILHSLSFAQKCYLSQRSNYNILSVLRYLLVLLIYIELAGTAAH